MLWCVPREKLVRVSERTLLTVSLPSVSLPTLFSFLWFFPLSLFLSPSPNNCAQVWYRASKLDFTAVVELREKKKHNIFSHLIQKRNYFIYSGCWVWWKKVHYAHTHTHTLPCFCLLISKSSSLKQFWLYLRGNEEDGGWKTMGWFLQKEKLCWSLLRNSFSGSTAKKPAFFPASTNFAELNCCLGHPSSYIIKHIVTLCTAEKHLAGYRHPPVWRAELPVPLAKMYLNQS